jgi:hypothetical protein
MQRSRKTYDEEKNKPFKTDPELTYMLKKQWTRI